MSATPAGQHFRARIEIVGVNPFVRVPARVSAAFGRRGYVPVTVVLERGEVDSTLIPRGGGVHRLYVNRQMLACTDARVGQRVSLTLREDAKPRMPRMPASLRRGLAARPLANARWHALSASRQKEVLRYLGFAKTSETRDRNIAKLLEILASDSGRGSLAGIWLGIAAGNS